MGEETLNNFDRERGLELLTMMERIRAFEENAVLAAERDKLVLGAIHPSFGQEATAAGIMWPLRNDDYLISTHRGHGHTLAKGADPVAMMRELLGRKGGCCGGKGGSMHIADFNVNMLGANGVVGANITIGAGAAHGIKLKGSDQVVVDIFGDGAVNRGPFLEGLNWAVVFKLPILFVCEDNQYSATTKTCNVTGGDGPAARAASLGLITNALDGNDVELIVDAIAESTDRIRKGGGPEFIHSITYRQRGHTSFDQAGYRPRGEAESNISDNDPIHRQQEQLLSVGVEVDEISAIHKAAQIEMAEALRLAAETPFPDDSTAFTDVQDIGSPEEGLG